MTVITPSSTRMILERFVVFVDSSRHQSLALSSLCPTMTTCYCSRQAGVARGYLVLAFEYLWFYLSCVGNLESYVLIQDILCNNFRIMQRSLVSAV